MSVFHCRNAHVECHDVQPLRVAAGRNCRLYIGRDLRRLELIGILKQRQLDAGEFQIGQALQRQRQ